MLETSTDILKLTLALSIAVFTGFICWGIASVTRIIRQISRMVDQAEGLISAVKDKIDRLEHLFSIVEEKVKSVSSTLPLIISGITQILQFVKNRKTRKADSGSRSKSKTAF